ncbi:MAG TPA: cupin domain-containing protein [Chthoniobacterales bacterium]
MSALAQSSASLQPETFLFKDDGSIPNNKLPLLIYRGAFPASTPDLASVIEGRYAENDWSGTWRAGVFPFHHYHSTTHEVLTVYSGTATLQLGGVQGSKFDVKAGDMIIIPAGVGHKRLSSDPDFGVVGAYPEGRRWDLLRGEPGERPQADRNIAAVPLPKNDPLYGPGGPLIQIWKAVP